MQKCNLQKLFEIKTDITNTIQRIPRAESEMALQSRCNIQKSVFKHVIIIRNIQRNSGKKNVKLSL
jgi:hypothetical protein